jgi:hypothetical protein
MEFPTQLAKHQCGDRGEQFLPPPPPSLALLANDAAADASKQTVA